MMLAVEIADPVFITVAGVLGTLLIAAVSYTAAALVRTTATLDRLDREANRQRRDHDDLEARVLRHFEQEKDRKIEELEIELAAAKGLAR